MPPGIVSGAQVKLRAMLLPPPQGPSYPGGYDFTRSLWFSRIGATGYPLGATTVTRPAPPPSGFVAGLNAFRSHLTRRLERDIGGGDKDGLTPEVDAAMRNAGMAHLLAISGRHIAVAVGGTMWLVRAGLALVPWIALRWPVRAIAAAPAAAAGIGCTVIAGGGAPTVCACIATITVLTGIVLTGIVLTGIVIGREALSLRMNTAAALLIMAIRPKALLGPSNSYRSLR